MANIIKRWLTRFLVLTMVGVGLYFAILSQDNSLVPIENSANLADPIREEEMRGKRVHVNSYDLDGNLISSGKSETVILVGDDQLALKDGLEYQFNREGRKYYSRADSFENLPDGRRKLSADPGNTILLAIEGGISIETEGPLLYGKDEVISTEAPAQFKMGEIKGRCVGLKYKPEVFLELSSDAHFTASSAEGVTTIDSTFMRLDYLKRAGEIHNGLITNKPANSHQENQLEATHFNILFHGQSSRELRLEEARLKGTPTRLGWGEGELTSSRIEVCFDETGKFLQEATTGDDAVYTSLSSDGGMLTGRTGQLTLKFGNGAPQTLTSQSPIEVSVEKQDRAPLKLTGEKGLESVFENSRVRSTRLFGNPKFQFASQKGHAGTLRVLHDERKVLLGETAHLEDTAQNLVVNGDEILLAEWDQDQQEIFANRFVEITYGVGTPEAMKAWGDTLAMKHPSQHGVLTGNPARIEQRDQTVQANRIEMERVGPYLFEMKTDDEVNLNLKTERGPVKIVAMAMFFSQEKNTVSFRNVHQALLADQGALSCKNLEILIPQTQEGRQVQKINASGSVVYEGQIKDSESVKSITARADTLTYAHSDRIIVFQGDQKDVVVTLPDGQIQGRKLTYNLNDGSMRVDSAAHGVTQTTVNLNDQKKKQLP